MVRNTVSSTADEAVEESAVFETGILSSTRRICTTPCQPSKVLTKADGKDIVKKSSARKNRFLFILNCELAPAASGQLGSLAKLDSRNPVMYIDFPDGRLKLFGRLVFPRNKYMVLKFGQKDVLCEDVLENLVVFSEAWWVGTQVENPEEQQLPMPERLHNSAQHTNYTFSSGVTAGSDDKPLSQPDIVPTPDGVKSEDEQEEKTQAVRVSSRSAGKRTRYNEDFDGSSDSELGEDTDGVPPLKLTKLSSSQKPSWQQGPEVDLRAVGATLQQSVPNLLKGLAAPKVAQNNTPSKAGASVPEGTPRTKTGAVKKVTAGMRKVPADDSDDHKIELLSDDDAVPAIKPASRGPRRAAAGAAARNIKQALGTDDNDGDEDDVVEIVDDSPAVKARQSSKGQKPETSTPSRQRKLVGDAAGRKPADKAAAGLARKRAAPSAKRRKAASESEEEDVSASDPEDEDYEG